MLTAWEHARKALLPPHDRYLPALFAPTPAEPDLSEIIRYEVRRSSVLFPVLVNDQGFPLSEPAWAVASRQTVWEQPHPTRPAQPRVRAQPSDIRPPSPRQEESTRTSNPADAQKTEAEAWIASQTSSVLTSQALTHASIVVVAALGVAADGTRLGQGLSLIHI